MSLGTKLLQIATFTATHTNTTTEAAFTQYLTIPVGSLRKGDRLKFGAIVEATSSTSSDTLTAYLMIGTTRTSSSTGIVLAQTPASDAVDGTCHVLSANARIAAIGAAGTASITYQGSGSFGTSTPATVVNAKKAATEATYFATTGSSDLYVYVVADWSAASSSDVATLVDLWCEITPCLPSL